MDTPAEPLLTVSGDVERQRKGPEGCMFSFVKADFVRGYRGRQMPFYQEMRAKHHASLQQVTLDYHDVIRGRYRGDILAISHRWMTVDSPDPGGEQLQALKNFLNTPKGKLFKLVWMDVPCMPQDVPHGARSSEDTALFKQMLPNINMVYLGASVLILLDLSYCSRFWTLTEAWLPMQSCTSSGLASSVGTPNERHYIRCIHNASEQAAAHSEVLVNTWKGRTTGEAFAILQKPDVMVTNQSDKDVQLPKICSLSATVKDAFASLKKERAAAVRRADEQLAAATAEYEQARREVAIARGHQENARGHQEKLELAIRVKVAECTMDAEAERKKQEAERKKQEEERKKQEEDARERRYARLKACHIVENDFQYLLPLNLDLCLCCGPCGPCGTSWSRKVVLHVVQEACCCLPCSIVGMIMAGATLGLFCLGCRQDYDPYHGQPEHCCCICCR